MKLVASLVLLSTIFLPMITNGPPLSFPEQIELVAVGYELVGDADVFVACTGDGTLHLGAYAIRPDGTQGHTVFAVNVAEATLSEQRGYRPAVVIRGSIFGQPLEDCGITDVLSVIISNEKAGQVIMQQGN